MSQAATRRPRGGPLAAFGALALLAMIAALGATVATAYNLGASTGLMAAGAVVLVYQVPAVVFDWPRITLEAVLGLFGFVWDLISSLWD